MFGRTRNMRRSKPVKAKPDAQKAKVGPSAEDKSFTDKRQAEKVFAAKKMAMLEKKSGLPAPTPFKFDATDPVNLRPPLVAVPKTGVLPSKPANMPMEQVEINKASKMAAIPQPYTPQANSAPNPQMAAMQKMPNPGLVSQANSMPQMPNPGGPPGLKRGGSVRNKPAAKATSGGKTGKASSRGDGIAQRGKTKGRMI